MNKTTKPWASLSDQEKVEWLAVEVMGWEKANYESDGLCYYRVGNKEYGVAELTWNPLKDWNHTMQVVMKVGAIYDCFREIDGRQTLFVHDNPQEAILESIYNVYE